MKALTLDDVFAELLEATALGWRPAWVAAEPTSRVALALRLTTIKADALPAGWKSGLAIRILDMLPHWRQRRLWLSAHAFVEAERRRTSKLRADYRRRQLARKRRTR